MSWQDHLWPHASPAWPTGASPYAGLAAAWVLPATACGPRSRVWRLVADGCVAAQCPCRDAGWPCCARRAAWIARRPACLANGLPYICWLPDRSAFAHGKCGRLPHECAFANTQKSLRLLRFTLSSRRISGGSRQKAVEPPLKSPLRRRNCAVHRRCSPKHAPNSLRVHRQWLAAWRYCPPARQIALGGPRKSTSARDDSSDHRDLALRTPRLEESDLAFDGCDQLRGVVPDTGLEYHLDVPDIFDADGRIARDDHEVCLLPYGD